MPKAVYTSCWYHKRVDVILLATHYGRHYCPSCERLDIVEICQHCAQNYEDGRERWGNYPWMCETCGATMERRVVGRIN